MACGADFRLNMGMKTIFRRNQMGFYDIDLEMQIAGKHELWEIEKAVAFSKFM